MIAGTIITVGVAVTLIFGRPALVSLRRWLDWRYAARMQVRRKLELHRSLLAKAATADNCQIGKDDGDDVPADFRATDPAWRVRTDDQRARSSQRR